MSLATLVLTNSALMCILVGFTEKSISQILIANPSTGRIPPLAKRRRYVLSRLMSHANNSFLISLASIAVFSSWRIFGIVTWFLNLTGMIIMSWNCRYDLTASKFSLIVPAEEVSFVSQTTKRLKSWYTFFSPVFNGSRIVSMVYFGLRKLLKWINPVR